MAFTSWSALLDDIKDKLADHVAGEPLTGEYSIGEHTLKYRSYDELVRLFIFVEKRADTRSHTSRTSYGRPRRFV